MHAAVCQPPPPALSASRITDSYFPLKLAKIARVAQSDPAAAAELHVRIEASIPAEVAGARRVVARLVECLDKLKATNPILRGGRVEREPEPATIVYILEAEAAKARRSCVAKGSVDGKAVFAVGNAVFGIGDGVVWLQRGTEWRPLFVGEIAGCIA
jgi:hypothetical protein